MPSAKLINIFTCFMCLFQYSLQFSPSHSRAVPPKYRTEYHQIRTATPGHSHFGDQHPSRNRLSVFLQPLPLRSSGLRLQRGLWRRTGGVHEMDYPTIAVAISPHRSASRRLHIGFLQIHQATMWDKIGGHFFVRCRSRKAVLHKGFVLLTYPGKEGTSGLGIYREPCCHRSEQLLPGNRLLSEEICRLQDTVLAG